MKTFIQWAGENRRELPLFPQTESSTTRAGVAHWAYPDGYIRSHYPDLWFTPSSADAIFKMSPGPPFTKKKHHVSHETPPDFAIGPDGSVRQEKEVDYETD
jgi:hypothetical protein